MLSPARAGASTKEDFCHLWSAGSWATCQGPQHYLVKVSSFGDTFPSCAGAFYVGGGFYGSYVCADTNVWAQNYGFNGTVNLHGAVHNSSNYFNVLSGAQWY